MSICIFRKVYCHHKLYINELSINKVNILQEFNISPLLLYSQFPPRNNTKSEDSL